MRTDSSVFVSSPRTTTCGIPPLRGSRSGPYRETARVGLGRLEEHEVRVKRAEEARERRRVERALRDGPKRR